jgi:hypothetical protein
MREVSTSLSRWLEEQAGGSPSLPVLEMHSCSNPEGKIVYPCSAFCNSSTTNCGFLFRAKCDIINKSLKNTVSKGLALRVALCFPQPSLRFTFKFPLLFSFSESDSIQISPLVKQTLTFATPCYPTLWHMSIPFPGRIGFIW